MDAKLGRQVLTQIEDNWQLFDTTVWGEADRSCGIRADIAGGALLESGWTLVGDNEFLSPDGDRLIHRPEDIEREAIAVLGLTEDEYWDNSDRNCLFVLPEELAVKRLRELVEAAEAVSHG